MLRVFYGFTFILIFFVYKIPGFLKRLPSNAEASNVLVGEVNFLEKPIAAFIRLANSCIIGDLTEVPIPTRFVFVMLGPAVSQGRYHEIGRAISTLMADDVRIRIRIVITLGNQFS